MNFTEEQLRGQYKLGFQEGRQQALRVLKEFGDKWEIPLEGNVSGEFEYVQFKEHPLFKQIEKELTGVNHSQEEIVEEKALKPETAIPDTRKGCGKLWWAGKYQQYGAHCGDEFGLCPECSKEKGLCKCGHTKGFHVFAGAHNGECFACFKKGDECKKFEEFS